MTVAVDATPNCIFLPTPSARRATFQIVADIDIFHTDISTHALREEGDGIIPDMTFAQWQFLPTPSARRATGTLKKSPFLR